MCDVIRDHSTSAYFAASARCGWYRDKVRYIVGDVHVAADQVVVLKKILPVMNSQYDGPGHIQRSPSANSNNRIPFGGIVNIGALVHV